MEIEKQFGAYAVTLDTNMDGAEEESNNRVTGCWIEYGPFTASLEALTAHDVLEDGRGGEHRVPRGVISEIEAWAIKNGY